MGRARTAIGSRSTGLVPLLAGVLSAAALTGAAVYTVTEVKCAPGHYVRDGHQITLVGSCVTGAELRDAGIGHDRDQSGASDTVARNVRP